MQLPAIRPSCRKTPAKSLVIRVSGVLNYETLSKGNGGGLTNFQSSPLQK